MVKTLLGLILSITLTNSPVNTINYLIEHSLTRDQQTVIIEGEILGEVLERGDNAWINVNDGTNAIGVYLRLDQTTELKVFGDYFNIGDKIRVVGVFERSCIEHGGEMDIHATSIQIIEPGRPIDHPVSSWKFVISIILMSIALFALYLKRHYFKKAEIKSEVN
ncbi:MAG: DNA-binding protein [Erysipelotrichaceae bacterium]|nr:DNA-binding protein [Erysipelotrichaceae bacterium]